MSQTEQSTYLFFTEGSSDKEYHAHLRPAPGDASGHLWGVYYANGPRGKVGQSKEKISPTTYELALKEYEKVIKTKKKDGYTEAESGVRFTNTEKANQNSGHSPQLSVAIDRARVQELLDDKGWGLQQKANGERRGIEIDGATVRGTNKLGLYVNIPETWVEQMRALGGANGATKLEGEQIGEVFYAFDLIEQNGKDLRSLGFEDRFARLVALTQGMIGPNAAVPCLRLLTLYPCATKEAQQFFHRLEEMNHEGAVLKKLSAPYISGRDENSLKFKFYESMTCRVAEHNKQRSVRISALDADQSNVEIGNVTIPANAEMPPVASLIEVQYLYYNPGGALEQPVYLGERNDILPSEATLAQITRYKPVDAEVDDEPQGEVPSMS